MGRRGVPMFFGPSARALYGVYHAPEDGHGERAVLLSAPVGHEYFRTHKMVRQLALSLSRAGLHVLRFDYSGAGDSAGSGEDRTLALWREDLVTAAEELRDMSGCRGIRVAGVRLGATLAATVEAFPCPVDVLALWDPVVAGSDYLEVLADLHSVLVRGTRPRGAPSELVGLPISRTLHEELRALRLLDRAPGWSGDGTTLLVARSRDRPEYRALQERLKAMGLAHEVHTVAEEYDWGHRGKIDAVITAPGMIRLLVERLASA